MKKPFLKLRDTWRLWRYRNKMRSGEYAGLLGDLSSSSHGESQSQWVPKRLVFARESEGQKVCGGSEGRLQAGLERLRTTLTAREET